MFEILPNPSLDTVLIALRAALLIGAFWVFAMAFTRWRRADERQAQQLQAQLERAFAEMRSLHETVMVMSARMEAMSERAEAEPRVVPVGTAGGNRGYDLATRLARNGAPIEELVETCGITRHEAELLTRLHASKQRESASVNWQARAVAERAPANWSMPVAAAKPAAIAAPAQAAPAPAPQAGRKRGSLLSVVG